MTTNRTEIYQCRVGTSRPVGWPNFETQRDHNRRELAERFANQRQTRTGAINELAALLDAEDELDRLAAEAIETARTEDFVISGRIRID